MSTGMSDAIENQLLPFTDAMVVVIVLVSASLVTLPVVTQVSIRGYWVFHLLDSLWHK